jgi:hypothetical protein
VNAIAAAPMNSDTSIDLVVGTKTGNNSGRVELFLNDGTGTMTSSDYAAADEVVLSVALGEIDLLDTIDIVAGTAAHSVQTWFCDPLALTSSGIIPTHESWADANAGGLVNAVSIRKIEAPANAPSLDTLNDIVCGTAISATSGEIVIYLNPFLWTYNP